MFWQNKRNIYFIVVPVTVVLIAGIALLVFFKLKTKAPKWEAGEEIIGQQELSQQDVQQIEQTDTEYGSIVTFAREQGFSDFDAAYDLELKTGYSVLIAAYHSQSKTYVYTSRFTNDNESKSVLIQITDEEIVMFDRDGGAKFTELGITVYDANENIIEYIPRAELQVPGSSLMMVSLHLASGCTTGYWGEFAACLTSGSGIGWSAACALAAAACAVEPTRLSCIGAIVACGSLAADCLIIARDNYPVISYFLEQAECKTCSRGGGSILTNMGVTVRASVTDDRQPGPTLQITGEASSCALGYHTAVITAVDCAGHTSSETVQYQVTNISSQVCDDNNECTDDKCENAACVYTPKACPTPTPTSPPPTPTIPPPTPPTTGGLGPTRLTASGGEAWFAEFPNGSPPQGIMAFLVDMPVTIHDIPSLPETGHNLYLLSKARLDTATITEMHLVCSPATHLDGAIFWWEPILNTWVPLANFQTYPTLSGQPYTCVNTWLTGTFGFGYITH